MACSIKYLFEKYRNFILYGIIGGCCATIDFVVTNLFYQYFDFNSLVSNVIGVTLGVTISFFLNAFYNFKRTNSLFRRALIFYLVGFLGLLLSLAILIVGDIICGYNKPIEFFGIVLGEERLISDAIDWNFIVVKLISIFVVALFQYFLNKLITFKK